MVLRLPGAGEIHQGVDPGAVSGILFRKKGEKLTGEVIFLVLLVFSGIKEYCMFVITKSDI